MNTCKYCKYWEREERNPNMGECNSGKLLAVLGENDLACRQVASWNKVPSDGLGATDASGYHVHIAVGKDFGCIHFCRSGL